MATTHTVVKGDTLYALAKKYNTTVSKLVELNNLKNANIIVIGQVLIVSGSSSEAVEPVQTTTSRAKITSYGLQADTDRTLVARWDWTRENTDHYEYRWWWGPEGQLGILGSEGTTEQQHAVYNAPSNAERVSFYVKPVSKKYKNGNTEVSYWTADWTTKETYYFKDNPPSVPSAPSVSIKVNQITITLENLDVNGTHIEFQIVKDDGTDWITDPIPIQYNSVTYTTAVDAGSDYKVRCRAVRNSEKSNWSSYSSNVGTSPAASDGITECRASSSTSVYLAWSAVANADSYDIEYSTKREYLDSSNQTTTQSNITATNYTLTGLESGSEYFFRVRAVNTNGKSAWSSIRSIVLGKKPAIPTTWSSTTTAIVGNPVILYWVHNSEDGSKQTKALLELTIDGNTRTVEVTPPVSDEDDVEPNSSYDFDTSGYSEGAELKWRVRTCGITGEYGEWSIQRTVDIYTQPTMVLRVTDLSDNLVESLTCFPFKISGSAGPNTQKTVVYNLSIVANESYVTVDHVGNEKVVTAGSDVYTEHFDISSQLVKTVSANDVDLENNISYTIKCVVGMDSGLTAEGTHTFTVAWTDEMCEPNAEIGINEETLSAIIRPFCEDANNELVNDITLAVYRREFNGAFTEIASELSNTRSTYVTDPHPSLDYARYRIVATTKSTGAVSYCDVAGCPVGGTAAILQWGERWSNFDVTGDGVSVDKSWSGSILKLPYNIDVTNNHSIDTALVKYIGRKHPVTYYGTQLGETATWTTDIPKNDKETLYALRRLAAWTGDVYVREPSGSGYWANVVVSFSQKHRNVVIPVTLDITRVEGGV